MATENKMTAYPAFAVEFKEDACEFGLARDSAFAAILQHCG
jgi:hypothetical protein